MSSGLARTGDTRAEWGCGQGFPRNELHSVTGVWYITYMDIEAITRTIDTNTHVVTEGYVNHLTLDVECECGQQQYHEVWEAGTVETRYTLAAVIPENIYCANCNTLLYGEGEEVVFDEADYEELSRRW